MTNFNWLEFNYWASHNCLLLLVYVCTSLKTNTFFAYLFPRRLINLSFWKQLFRHFQKWWSAEWQYSCVGAFIRDPCSRIASPKDWSNWLLSWSNPLPSFHPLHFCLFAYQSGKTIPESVLNIIFNTRRIFFFLSQTAIISFINLRKAS